MNRFHANLSARSIVLFVFLVLSIISLQAQKVVISGTVTNEQTGEPIAQANVIAGKSGLAVVTNDDGFFTLKAERLPDAISISHLGFQSRKLRLSSSAVQNIVIKLKPTAVQLQEVVVWTDDPEELVRIAISKIPDNYSRVPELYNCFYRETAKKRNHFIYVAEGVVDMYKTSYTRNSFRDRVAIRKGRRLLSPKRNDTLSVKVVGGPVQPIQLDIVKNSDILLNEQELSCYYFKMEYPEVIDNRQQFVVSISPKLIMPYPLYFGKLYIDRETLAFTRAELSLDMTDRLKATEYMLVSKPRGVRFRPKELSCLVNYRYENGVTRISYIRNTFRFNCDWKRRLFATSFTAFCEMVVTDKTSENVEPISGRSSFDSRDAFYDKVDYFRDPNFWENYNIIEPTISLDEAIDKLVKKYK
ncbi:MAG: carboxypeptidase-like regulatory domain-containing protein [Prevotella sp.]|nr:carboxypeptidase-like regulatory domain-containing protein [Prevotella sp.]